MQQTHCACPAKQGVGRRGAAILSPGGSVVHSACAGGAQAHQVYGCHIVRRGARDVAIRFSCGSAERKAAPRANPSTNLPYVLLVSTRLCGDADCHASSPQSPPCPALAFGQSRATLPWGSSPRKGFPFAGPHALVRNDIHKLAACPHCKDTLPWQIPTRLWFHPAVPPYNRRSPSVFCMSLRGAGRATWQSVLLAVAHNEKQYPRQIRNHLRIRPEYCVFFPISAGRGLPHQ